jgi:uncharacterized protein (TIGR02391 family)
MATQREPPFESAHLERLARILADTESGLTGSQIDHFLREAKVANVDPLATKWRRLFNALVDHQNKHQVGNGTFSFIRHALAPARFLANRNVFETYRRDVNAVLSFRGVEYRDDGKFYRVEAARTLGEAEQRAGRLRAVLSERGAHRDVIAACRAELLADNYFHAVLEACKSVAQKLRSKAGLQSDGADLVTAALLGAQPVLRINAYVSDSEKSEQKGFGQLLIGLFGTFRNPTAHTLRTAWSMDVTDAIDLFTLASFAHRRLDRASRR